jgi:hypothetical protein
MSADNWAICPQCLNNAKTKQQEMEQKLKDSYGIMDVDEWLKFKGKVEIGFNEEDLRTLREDYVIGIFEDGEFLIHYSGRCSTCGLDKDYKHKEQIVEMNNE